MEKRKGRGEPGLRRVCRHRRRSIGRSSATNGETGSATACYPIELALCRLAAWQAGRLVVPCSYVSCPSYEVCICRPPSMYMRMNVCTYCAYLHTHAPAVLSGTYPFRCAHAPPATGGIRHCTTTQRGPPRPTTAATAPSAYVCAHRAWAACNTGAGKAG